MRLKGGKYYWFRSKDRMIDPVWRVGYVGYDPDEQRWFYMMCCPPIKLSQMRLRDFEFIEIPKPKE
jgi:hypothetical protein